MRVRVVPLANGTRRGPGVLCQELAEPTDIRESGEPR